MKIPLSFKRMFLEPGNTLAVPTVAGSRVRVVDGLVWATTSGNLDDVWLAAGDEHTVRGAGLTVIESVGRSTVDLFPQRRMGRGGRGKARFDLPVPGALFNVAAVAMTVITLGLLVVLPAKLAAPVADADGTTIRAETLADRGGGIVIAPKPTIARATQGQRAASRVE